MRLSFSQNATTTNQLPITVLTSQNINNNFTTTARLEDSMLFCTADYSNNNLLEEDTSNNTEQQQIYKNNYKNTTQAKIAKLSRKSAEERNKKLKNQRRSSIPDIINLGKVCIIKINNNKAITFKKKDFLVFKKPKKFIIKYLRYIYV